jgi:hypothetical protein
MTTPVQPYAPYGTGSPAPRPPAERSTVVALGVIGASLLVGGGIAVATTFGGPSTPQEAAQEGVHQMLDRDWAGMWELTCQEERDDYSGGFQEFVRNRDRTDAAPLDGEITVGDVHFDDKGSDVAYLVDIEIRSFGATEKEDLRVVRENGEWRICE